jgi:hypothetical protein
MFASTNAICQPDFLRAAAELVADHVMIGLNGSILTL